MKEFASINRKFL